MRVWINLTKDGKPIRDKNNEKIVFCCGASVDTGEYGMNDLKLKYFEGDAANNKEPGYFVEFPRKRLPNGQWKDICLTTHRDSRTELTNAVVQAYHDKLRAAQTPPEIPPAPELTEPVDIPQL